MFNSIFTKTLYDKRWMIFGWSIGLAIMNAVNMVFYPSFANSSQYTELLNQMPPELKSLVGQSLNFGKIEGYTNSQIFALNLPLLLIILVIMFYSATLAGEEDNGTLGSLLAQPVSRAKVLVHKYLAGVTIAGIVSTLSWIGLIAAIKAINYDISLVRTLAATLQAMGLALVFGSLAYAIGAITGKRSLAVSVPTVLAVASFFLYSLAAGVKSLEPYRVASMFYYYNKTNVLESGLNYATLAVFLALTIGFVGLAWLGFRKRDIRG